MSIHLYRIFAQFGMIFVMIKTNEVHNHPSISFVQTDGRQTLRLATDATPCLRTKSVNKGPMGHTLTWENMCNLLCLHLQVCIF